MQEGSDGVCPRGAQSHGKAGAGCRGEVGGAPLAASAEEGLTLPGGSVTCLRGDPGAAGTGRGVARALSSHCFLF